MSARLMSLNVGTPFDAEWAGNLKRTAIVKTQVDGPTRVHSLGVEGDEIADTVHHGGTYQAVYAYAREDLDAWSERLGLHVPNGQFGENLTTEGIDVNEALVGEQWQIGSVVVEIADVRIPCSVFQNYMGLKGFDSDKWIKRFTLDARPGPYLKVVQEGELQAGDAIAVVHKPDHDISVSTMFRALTTERQLLPRLLEIGPGLAPDPRAAVERYLSRTN